jgi:hypothetical protein
MDSLIALTQTLAAFCIFVAGYLVLMLSVVICFFIGTCVYKVGCLGRAYKARSALLDHRVIS